MMAGLVNKSLSLASILTWLVYATTTLCLCMTPEVEDRLGAIRQDASFVLCWTLPSYTIQEQESQEQFQHRLEQCESYYRHFLRRRFESWGHIRTAIHRWTSLINWLLEPQPLHRLQDFVTLKPDQLPWLAQELHRSFSPETFPPQEQRREEHEYVRSTLQGAFERGSGICTDLSSPMMLKFYRLIEPIRVTIINYTPRRPTDYIIKFLQNRDPQGDQLSVLLVYLVQHLCSKLNEISYSTTTEHELIFNYHMGEQISMANLMAGFMDEVRSGLCSLRDVSNMALIHNFFHMAQFNDNELLWLSIDVHSRMLYGNCMKLLHRMRKSLNHMDVILNKQAAFRYYKTSWKLMKLIQSLPLQPRQKTLDLINIRADDCNEVDYFFFQDDDPSLMDAYMFGGGICSVYRSFDFYGADMYRLWFIQIMERLISVQLFKPPYSERVIAFYYMEHICEQARLLPFEMNQDPSTGSSED